MRPSLDFISPLDKSFDYFVSLQFPPILQLKEKAPTLRQEPLIYDKMPRRNLYRPVEIALPHVVKALNANHTRPGNLQSISRNTLIDASGAPPIDNVNQFP
jgi:hypothetical protein